MKPINFILLFTFIICIAIDHEIIRLLGVIGYWSYWLICIASSKLKFKIKTDLKIIIPLAVLIIWMSVTTINTEGISSLCKFILLSIFFLFDFPFKTINVRAMQCFAILIAALVILDFKAEAIFMNPNMTSLLVFIPFFICTIACKLNSSRFIFISIGLILCILLGSRSVLFSIFFAWVIVHFWTRNQFKFFNLTIVFFLFIIIGNYWFFDYLMSPEFNALVFKYTGKEFQTGRFEMWAPIFAKMEWHNYLIGLGGGYNFGELMPVRFKNLSLHSTYIYMLCSYGIIGLLLFFTLLYQILSYLMKNGKKISAFLLLFFLFRDCFEITIVNNQMAIAVIFWAMIANGKTEKIFGMQNNSEEDNAASADITTNTSTKIQIQ